MASNPTLNEQQLVEARKVLEEVRQRIQQLAGGDADLVFAYRRKIGKELGYDERSKPDKRRRLKRQVIRRQNGLCIQCKEVLPPRGSVLDRREAKAGYVPDNVEVVCRACDAARQGTKGLT